MSTLNYWLGKLQRLQLFGKGTKPMKCITVDPKGKEIEYTIVDIRVINDVVYIELE